MDLFCSKCRRCVRRMDHHCIWTNNCIGELNFKYFYLFLVYGGEKISRPTGYASTVMCIYIYIYIFIRCIIALNFVNNTGLFLSMEFFFILFLLQYKYRIRKVGFLLAVVTSLFEYLCYTHIHSAFLISQTPRSDDLEKCLRCEIARTCE